MPLRQYCVILLLALVTLLAANTGGTIQGTVSDGANRTPLSAVNISIDGHSLGAASGDDGSYRIEEIPPGTYTLRFDYLGYAPLVQTDVVVRNGRITFLNVVLREALVSGEAVTVTAGFFQDGGDPGAGVTRFSTEEVRRTPGSAGDINRVISILPSVASRGENSQDLIVRGGSPIENGFYVDDIPIPQVYHFTTAAGSSNGPVGLLNTDLMDRVDFYFSGIGARFGNRLSSVVDVRYRDGNRETFDGQIDLNLAGFGGVLEGPLGRRGSWLVSARRSYLDLIADAINTGGAPIFGDAQAKLVFDLAPTQKLTLLNIYGNSDFEVTDEDAAEEEFDDTFKAVRWQNTSGLNLLSVWGKKAWSSTSVAASVQHSNFDQRTFPAGRLAVQNRFKERTYTLRHGTHLELHPRFSIDLGGEIERENHRYTYRRLLPDTTLAGTVEAVEERLGRALDATRSGAHFSVTLRPLSRMSATLGLRGDYYSNNDEFTVDPRFAMAFTLSPRLTLKGSLGRFHQTLPGYLQSQRPAFTRLESIAVDQATAGLDYLLTVDSRLSIEYFEKRYRNAPQAAAGAAPLGPLFVLDDTDGGVTWTTLNSTGEATARGIEILVQKKLATAFYGIVSGSWFRSRYLDFAGVERSRTYDSEWLMNLIGGWKPNSRWEFSARFSYLGERPDTPIDVRASQAAGGERRFIERTNEGRLPAYHSLFLRADRRFNFANSTLITYLSLWNAYNHRNIDQYEWNRNAGEIREVTQFGLLPVFGMEYEF